MPTVAFSVAGSSQSAASSVPLRPFRGCYPYRPVGDDDLRLLCLYPSEEGDEIQCSIIHTRASRKPQYEALSYAWGSPDTNRSIRVDGKRIRVRENLFHALRALRPPLGHSGRRLWVDALCINQKNPVETFREVQKMVPIYACASRVICWLGKDASKEARTVVKFVRAVNTTLGDRDITDKQGYKKFYSLYMEQSDVVSAFMKLFALQPYWRRVWIRQELISAAEIIIQCGHHTLPWNDAARACAALEYLTEYSRIAVYPGGEVHFEHLAWIHASRLLFGIVDGPERFLDQLIACRSAEAKHLEDKVYGLCGLLESIPDEDSQRLTPNYGFKLVEVYLQAFQYCVFDCTDKPRSDHCLNILCSSRLQSHRDSEFPSWLPDWSQSVNSVPFSPRLRPGISASLGRKAEVIINWDQDRKLLKCKGLRLGIIDRIGGCFRDPQTNIESFYMCRLAAFCSWCDMVDEISELDKRWHRLISLLWLGTDFHDVHDEDLFEDLDEAVEEIIDFRHKMDQAKGYTSPPSAFVRLVALTWLNYRRLAVSDRSKLVLVPEEAREGDRICVIYGCSIPILLRRYDRETFQVVGDCYVEGYMDGEAIQARNRRELRSTEFTLR